MKAIVLIGALVLLSGCVSAEELAQRDDATCASYGATAGTPQYTQCRLQVAAQRDEQRRAEMAAFGQAMQNMAAQQQAQYAAEQQALQQQQLILQQQQQQIRMPTTTNCTRVGNGVSCTTF